MTLFSRTRKKEGRKREREAINLRAVTFGQLSEAGINSKVGGGRKRSVVQEGILFFQSFPLASPPLHHATPIKPQPPHHSFLSDVFCCIFRQFFAPPAVVSWAQFLPAGCAIITALISGRELSSAAGGGRRRCKKVVMDF